MVSVVRDLPDTKFTMHVEDGKLVEECRGGVQLKREEEDPLVVVASYDRYLFSWMDFFAQHM